MPAKKLILPPEWDDDYIPEWTEEVFDAAQIRIGDKIIRPATGVLTKEGVRPQPRHPGEGRDPVPNKKPPSAISGPPGPRPSPG